MQMHGKKSITTGCILKERSFLLLPSCSLSSGTVCAAPSSPTSRGCCRTTIPTTCGCAEPARTGLGLQGQSWHSSAVPMLGPAATARCVVPGGALQLRRTKGQLSPTTATDKRGDSGSLIRSHRRLLISRCEQGCRVPACRLCSPAGCAPQL